MTSRQGLLPWANGVLALFALSAVGVIGWIALRRNRVAAPIVLSPGIARDRSIARAAAQALSTGDFVEAERQYRTALSYHPTRLELMVGRAQALVGLGRRREAWEVYRPIVEPCLRNASDPKGSWDSLVWYADLEAEFGDAQNVDRAVRRVVRVQVHDDQPVKKRLSLAHLWVAQKRTTPLAFCHLRRALSLDPSSIAARLAIAARLLDRSESSKAERLIAQARQLADKGDGLGWMALADFYQDRHDGKAMNAALDRAFGRISRANAREWLSAHRVAERMECKEFARVAMENARKAVRPSDADILYELAQRYQTRGDKEKALALAETAKRAMRPSEGGRYGWLALIFLNAGKKEKAKTMLRAAIPYTTGPEHDSLDRLLAPLEGRPMPPWSGGSGLAGVAGGKPFAPYDFS